MDKNESNVIKSMPIFMLIFVTSASLLGAFNIISPQIMIDFKINFSTVSLLAMIGILVIGLASVIYSTLSDKVSIRKLMLIGVALFNTGAILALVSSYLNFYLFVVSVALMVFGGTCGSGLMIVTATRYLAEDKRAKYYGYNAACVGVSQLVGILAGGFIATYLGWRLLFIFPLISLLTIPAIKKYIPNEKSSSDEKIDVFGLGLFTLFALLISLFFIVNNFILLVLSIVALLVFLVYISKNNKAFINISFFKNKNFVIINVLALLIFGLQSGFSFMFPFMAQGVYNLTLDKVSILLFPSFLIAVVVGASSGRIVEKLGSFRSLSLAMVFSIIATVIAAVTIDKGLVVLSIVSALYAGSFALMYAPFMKLVTSTLKSNQVGVGIGFFNLMTGIGPSLLIAMTGRMLSMSELTKDFGIVNTEASIFSNILLTYGCVLFISILVLSLNRKNYSKSSGGK